MRGNVRQRAKGTWTLTFELPPDPATGKRRQGYETVRGTKRDALRRLNDLQAEVNKGGYVCPSHLTLGQYLDQWKSHSETTTRAVTAEGYAWYVDHYIKPPLGHLSLSAIQPTHVQQLLADLLKRGLSAQTVRHCRTIFGSALGQAVDWGMLTRNAVDATAPPRPKRREIKPLTPNEVERLLSVAQDSDYYPAIFTALWTGMRRSELLGLRWRDVDLVMGSINVTQVRHRLRGGRTVYEEPKSRMGKRAISMPPSLTILLREQRDRQAAVRERLGQDSGLDDLIFTWPDGRPLLPNSFSHAFLRIRRKAGLDARLHDMRHTHASLMLREGVHQKVVQERLGHSSIAITSDIYSHLFPGMQEEAADKFDRALAGSIPKNTPARERESLPLTNR